MCVINCGSAQVDAPARVLPHPQAPRCSYQPPLGLDERPVLPVHLVVEAAGVAQVVAGAIAAPQRRGQGPAVDALAPLAWELLQELSRCGSKAGSRWTRLGPFLGAAFAPPFPLLPLCAFILLI